MRIVVTGALGHIGSKLIRALPEMCSNAQITMIDNFRTQRYCSLFDLPPQGRYDFAEADVLTADLDRLFQETDVVIHLAAITNAAASFQIRDEVEQHNYDATERVARSCARTSTALIFASSTSVYGTQRDEVDEECGADDLQPQSPYAETKLKEEQLLSSLAASDRLRYVVLRLGTIFGTSPGMRFHTAVNKFCWQAVMGQPLTVWRSALNQVRPYLDLEDAVSAMVHVIKQQLFAGRVYNVLTVNETVQGILDLIEQRIDEIDVDFVDSEIMNQLSYRVSTERFESTGFRYNGNLQRGIAATIRTLSQAKAATAVCADRSSG